MQALGGDKYELAVALAGEQAADYAQALGGVIHTEGRTESLKVAVDVTPV